MGQRTPRGGTLIVIILIGGLVFAAANVIMLMVTERGTVEVPLLQEVYRLCAPCLVYFIAAPLVFAVLIAIVVRQLSAALAASRTAAPVAATPAPPEGAAALRLLALLQQEGRLIDFLQEDISGYSDAQVGAAVRSIHAGCRKALHERLELRRIFADEDGAAVVVESGFDPSAVRLTGNVTGSPPFRGTLQHGGWRATRVSLSAAAAATDATIIAPAEVEIA